MVTEYSHRRLLRELEILYGNNPSLREVISEGRRDAAMIRRYLKDRGAKDAAVYSVDDRLEVPADLVQQVGAERGAKGRLVAAAAEIERWNAISGNVTCIVDLDRDFLSENRRRASGLLSTDHGAMDAYFLQARPVGKFVDEVAPGRISPDGLISALIPALNELFCVRAVLHEVHVGLIQNYTRCCLESRGAISVDAAELLRRSLAKAGKSADLGPALERLEAVRGQIRSGDFRAINGHDIAPLIVLELQLKNQEANVGRIEAEMRMCVTSEDLDDTLLFTELRRRLGL